MNDETKTATPEVPKPAPKPEYQPRRVKAVTQTSRGTILVDADTGEDLRLPTMSVTVEPFGVQANCHLTMHLVGVEKEKR